MLDSCSTDVAAISIAGAKSAYEDTRPCSVASRPIISSSREARSPIVALITRYSEQLLSEK